MLRFRLFTHRHHISFSVRLALISPFLSSYPVVERTFFSHLRESWYVFSLHFSVSILYTFSSFFFFFTRQFFIRFLHTTEHDVTSILSPISGIIAPFLSCFVTFLSLSRTHSLAVVVARSFVADCGMVCRRRIGTHSNSNPRQMEIHQRADTDTKRRRRKKVGCHCHCRRLIIGLNVLHFSFPSK